MMCVAVKIREVFSTQQLEKWMRMRREVNSDVVNVFS